MWVLVTVGDSGAPAALPALPPNVCVERWVPQQDILAHAVAMVCHGGTGTVLGGLAAGVPMVVVPQFANQPDNAERVAAVGAGIDLGGGAMAEEIAALPPVDEAAGFLAKHGYLPLTEMALSVW